MVCWGRARPRYPRKPVKPAPVRDEAVFVKALGFDLIPDEVQFAENPEPRCPCVLVLDVSTSMRGEKIGHLNEGLTTLEGQLKADPLASLRVEVAIVTFGSDAKTVQDFVSADKFNAPTLKADGTTAMSKGIHRALDMIERRKQKYNDNGIDYYRPWLFLITDGEPTEFPNQVKSAAERLMDEHENKGVVAFSVGVVGADMDKLRLISPTKPLELEGLDFDNLFAWLSNSMSRVSASRTGEDVDLDIEGLKYWATAV